MTTYILQTGDYERNRNILVTTDVKLVANKYIKLINKGAFGSLDNPYIEIWNEGDENYPTAHFHENTNDEQRLIKYLTKLAKEIE
jgi:hypothetical protein